MEENVFLNLPPAVPEGTEISSFWIVPWQYELEFASRNGGLDLGKIEPGSFSGRQTEYYRKFTPYFNTYQPREAIDVERCVSGVYPELRKIPHCLQIDSIGEMNGHISRLYQISYSHYIIGKNLDENKIDRFPKHHCYSSSLNTMLSSIKHGYSMATSVYDYSGNHAFQAVPFIMQGEKGFIVSDPTSDQLWNLDLPPRNTLFVSLGESLSYSAPQWPFSRKAPLVPTQVISIKNVCAWLQREKEECPKEEFPVEKPEEYFPSAFSNPVKPEISGFVN